MNKTIKNNINPLIANYLSRKGVTTPEEMDKLLIDQKISDPFQMMNMDKILDRIKVAIDQKQKIVICGDYDADGTVSTAMLVRFFKELNYSVSWYIPHRVEEGYGISAIGVEKLVADGAKLLISVDNGIAAFDAGKKSLELGVDLIITDHHDVVDNKQPECFAILNPKIEDLNRTYRYLAGAGVALYLIRAMKRYFKATHINLDKYLLLCTIASIADVVPLRDENRTIVKKGLEILYKHNEIPGITYLLIEAGIKLNYLSEVTAQDIGYKVVPMLNAAGRLEGAEKTILLLIEDQEDNAKDYARALKALNLRRRGESELLLALVTEQADLTKPMIICGGDGYHEGIIGVTAGKLKNDLRKPTIIVSFNDKGIGKGSCRSIEGFNMVLALESHRDLLIKFGGHYMAAGFSIEKSKFKEFSEKMENYFKEKYDPKLAKAEVDLELKIDDLTQDLLTQFQSLEPFGAKLELPIVEYTGKITEISVIKQKHLLLKLDNKVTCWFFFDISRLEDIQKMLYIKVIGEMTVKNKSASIIAKRIIE